MTFTAASGTTFTCGDGTGRPVSARFLSPRTERRILLNPELALGEAYMDGTFVVENGSIADALAIAARSTRPWCRNGARLQWWLRYLARHISSSTGAAGRESNVAHHYDLSGVLYRVSRRGQAVFVRLFPAAGGSAGRGAARQGAGISRRSCARRRGSGCSISARGWGGLGARPRRGRRRRRHGITLAAEQGVGEGAAAERAGDRVRLSARTDYRAVTGTVRPHRVGRHVRAVGAPTISSSSGTGARAG